MRAVKAKGEWRARLQLIFNDLVSEYRSDAFDTDKNGSPRNPRSSGAMFSVGREDELGTL